MGRDMAKICGGFEMGRGLSSKLLIWSLFVKTSLQEGFANDESPQLCVVEIFSSKNGSQNILGRETLD
jgi:hypothetical protein